MKPIYTVISPMIASASFSMAFAAQGAISDNDPGVNTVAVAAAAQPSAPAVAGAEVVTQRASVDPASIGATSDWCEYQQVCRVDYYGNYFCQWRYICF